MFVPQGAGLGACYNWGHPAAFTSDPCGPERKPPVTTCPPTVIWFWALAAVAGLAVIAKKNKGAAR
jgi:hypothetical protein